MAILTTWENVWAVMDLSAQNVRKHYTKSSIFMSKLWFNWMLLVVFVYWIYQILIRLFVYSQSEMCYAL